MICERCGDARIRTGWKSEDEFGIATDIAGDKYTCMKCGFEMLVSPILINSQPAKSPIYINGELEFGRIVGRLEDGTRIESSENYKDALVKEYNRLLHDIEVKYQREKEDLSKRFGQVLKRLESKDGEDGSNED